MSLSYSVLFERIQAVTDLQMGWLLLVFCAASRANYCLRVVHPRLVRTFAERQDAAVWRCLQGLLGIEGDGMTLDLAQLPFHWDGLGLRSAVRSSCAAHWASWADSLPMIQKRHPAIARLIIAQLTDQSDGFHLSGAAFSRERLLDVSHLPFRRGSRSRRVSAQANHRRHGRARSQVCLATDGNSSRPRKSVSSSMVSRRA